jgi:hypothetical protein
MLGNKSFDDSEQPAWFLWARGGAALEKNWESGDFETWMTTACIAARTVSSSEQVKYGVRVLSLHQHPRTRSRIGRASAKQVLADKRRPCPIRSHSCDHLLSARVVSAALACLQRAEIERFLKRLSGTERHKIGEA